MESDARGAMFFLLVKKFFLQPSLAASKNSGEQENKEKKWNNRS